MNDTLEVLFKRKSVRAYPEKQISAEVKSQVLQATLRAPTAGNMMLYSIIDVTDQPSRTGWRSPVITSPSSPKRPWSGCSWPITSAGSILPALRRGEACAESGPFRKPQKAICSWPAATR